MNQINLSSKLTQIGASSFISIITTVGSMLIAPYAQAELEQPLICFSDTFENLLAQEVVECDDKLFDNFIFNPQSQLFDIIVDINKTGNLFSFAIFDICGPCAREGFEYSFDVEILPSMDEDKPNQVFDSIALDSDAVPVGDSDTIVIKFVEILEVHESFSPPDDIQLISFGGLPDGPVSILGATKINIQDNLIIPTLEGRILSVTNSFTQRVKTSEPTTILGLLAIGSLGLSLRYKK